MLNLAELEKRLQTVEDLLAEDRLRLQTVEDMLAIDRLQKIYGYFLDYGQYKKAIDCFSDNAESIEISEHGVFKGKEGIRRFFREYMGRGAENDEACIPPGKLHFHMMHQGVVTVDPDGKTAKGRWYIAMTNVIALEEGGPIRSIIGHGVYENEFIKEEGVWKYKKMLLSLHYRSPICGGWAETPMIGGRTAPGPDAPPTVFHPYPNLQMLPYHFEHPVRQAKKSLQMDKKNDICKK